jgi:hypothetical protein
MFKFDFCQSKRDSGPASGNHQPWEALTTLGSTISVIWATWRILPNLVSITSSSPSFIPYFSAVRGCNSAFG